MIKKTLIIGPESSGKTKKAKNIADNYSQDKVVWINHKITSYDDPYIFGECTNETEMLIIDEVWSIGDIYFYEGLTRLGIRVERPGKERFYIYPKIIIVCSGEVELEHLINCKHDFVKRKFNVLPIK